MESETPASSTGSAGLRCNSEAAWQKDSGRPINPPEGAAAALLKESETPASSTGSAGLRCNSEAASQKDSGSQINAAAAANVTAPSVVGARTMPIMPGASPVTGGR